MFLRACRAAAQALVVAFIIALPTMADYEAGQRALDAGDPGEALSQWRAAAGTDDRRAMLELGRLYTQGLGVLQDYVEAHKWFNLAASRGEAAAAQERDALAERMTPRQVAAAQKRASEWQPAADETVEVSEADVATAPISDAGPPRQTIHEAQVLLAELGYEPGAFDGVWSSDSARAYGEFLRDAGLRSGETLTPEALRAMRGAARRQRDDADVALSAAQEPSETNQSDADDAAFAAAKAEDCASPACEAEAYQRYLQQHPNGRHASEALRLMEEAKRMADDTRFAQAKSEATVDAYQRYLLAHPEGRHASEARRLLEEAKHTADDSAFTKAKAKDTSRAYEQYLEGYPNGRHSAEARQLHADATRVEERRNLVQRISDKNFSGTYENGDRITYRFLRTGKVIGTYDPGWFFGLPTTSSCSGKWRTNGGNVQFNCDYGVGGSNILVVANLEGNVLVCREKTWMGIETVRLTN